MGDQLSELELVLLVWQPKKLWCLCFSCAHEGDIP